MTITRNISDIFALASEAMKNSNNTIDIELTENESMSETASIDTDKYISKEDLTKTLIDFCHGEELVDDEVKKLRDKIVEIYGGKSFEQLCTAVLSSVFEKDVQKEVAEIMEDRVKVFRVTIAVEGEVEVFIKAYSEDEAEDFAQNLDYYELRDKLSDCCSSEDWNVSYVEEVEGDDYDYDATEE